MLVRAEYLECEASPPCTCMCQDVSTSDESTLASRSMMLRASSVRETGSGLRGGGAHAGARRRAQRLIGNNSELAGGRGGESERSGVLS